MVHRGWVFVAETGRVEWAKEVKLAGFRQYDALMPDDTVRMVRKATDNEYANRPNVLWYCD